MPCYNHDKISIRYSLELQPLRDIRSTTFIIIQPYPLHDRVNSQRTLQPSLRPGNDSVRQIFETSCVNVELDKFVVDSNVCLGSRTSYGLGGDVERVAESCIGLVNNVAR
jgi:hypothetical protein